MTDAGSGPVGAPIGVIHPAGAIGHPARGAIWLDVHGVRRQQGNLAESGVHDLAPMPLFSFNSDLKLDAAEAAQFPPVNRAPRSRAPILVVAGAEETSEFRRQPQLLWDRWPRGGPNRGSNTGRGST